MKKKFKTLQISKEEQSKITGGRIGGGMTCTYQDGHGGLYEKTFDRVIDVVCDTSNDCLGCW